MSFHALHYSRPGHPVLFRFAEAAHREAWIAEHPSFRRAIAPPRHDPGGWLAGPVTVPGYPMVTAAFREAGIDDLATPPDDLAQRVIDRLQAPVLPSPSPCHPTYGAVLRQTGPRELIVVSFNSIRAPKEFKWPLLRVGTKLAAKP